MEKMQRREFMCGSLAIGTGVSALSVGWSSPCSLLPPDGRERPPGTISGRQLALALQIARDLANSEGWLKTRGASPDQPDSIEVDVDRASYMFNFSDGPPPLPLCSTIAAVVGALSHKALLELPYTYEHEWVGDGMKQGHSTSQGGSFMGGIQDDTFDTWMPFWAANETSFVSIESITRLLEGIYCFKNDGLRALFEAVAAGEITEEMLKEPQTTGVTA